MFRNIFRALVLFRTKSTAMQIANQLSQRDLADIGYSRYDIVNTAVENVRKELDQADIKKAQNAASGKTTVKFFPDFIANTFLHC